MNEREAIYFAKKLAEYQRPAIIRAAQIQAAATLMYGGMALAAAAQQAVQVSHAIREIEEEKR
jgi:hypothetical protein